MESFPVVEDPPCNAKGSGITGLIPGSEKSPGGGSGSPLLYSCLENSMDRERSLEGYSPWGHKESDSTDYRGGVRRRWADCDRSSRNCSLPPDKENLLHCFSLMPRCLSPESLVSSLQFRRLLVPLMNWCLASPSHFWAWVWGCWLHCFHFAWKSLTGSHPSVGAFLHGLIFKNREIREVRTWLAHLVWSLTISLIRRGQRWELVCDCSMD